MGFNERRLIPVPNDVLDFFETSTNGPVDNERKCCQNKIPTVVHSSPSPVYDFSDDEFEIQELDEERKEFTCHFSDLNSLLTSHDLEKEFA